MKKILKFPLLRQTYNYDCGANVVQNILGYYGLDVREGNIMKIARTKKSGTNIGGIKKVLKYFGLSYEEKKMNIQTIKKYLNKKIPVILMIQAWTEQKDVNWKNDWKDGHYVTAIGYDKNKIYFQDPSSEKITFLTYKQLGERWHDKDTKNKKIINQGLAVKRNKYSKNPHPEKVTDYKEYGKTYRYDNKKVIHMG